MDYMKLSKKGAILVSNNSTKYIHTALTGKMDDVLRYPELSVKSLCYLMSPENLHSQTKKIPKKTLSMWLSCTLQENTQNRLHVLISCELKQHENHINAANYIQEKIKALNLEFHLSNISSNSQIQQQGHNETEQTHFRSQKMQTY